MVGGQDELVFDGGSFAMDAGGEVCVFGRRPLTRDCTPVTLGAGGVRRRCRCPAAAKPISTSRPASTRRSLPGRAITYDKHGFPGVILGLSGGVDSALVAAIACDAIGADRVRAVMMPFRYTSNMSQEDAAKQAATMAFATT